MSEDKINEIVEIIYDFVPCMGCPCHEYCPYIFLNDKHECIKILKKWIKDEY